jgi:hypothetical protein
MARTPIRESAYTALAARLMAALPDVPVERNRRGALNDGECPRLVLRDGPQQPNRQDAVGEDMFSMQATLEGYIDAPDEAAIGQDLSTLYARRRSPLRLR